MIYMSSCILSIQAWKTRSLVWAVISFSLPVRARYRCVKSPAWCLGCTEYHHAIFLCSVFCGSGVQQARSHPLRAPFSFCQSRDGNHWSMTTIGIKHLDSALGSSYRRKCICRSRRSHPYLRVVVSFSSSCMILVYFEV